MVSSIRSPTNRRQGKSPEISQWVPHDIRQGISQVMSRESSPRFAHDVHREISQVIRQGISHEECQGLSHEAGQEISQDIWQEISEVVSCHKLSHEVRHRLP